MEYMKILKFERWRKLREGITVSALQISPQAKSEVAKMANKNDFISQRIIGGKIKDKVIIEL